MLTELGVCHCVFAFDVLMPVSLSYDGPSLVLLATGDFIPSNLQRFVMLIALRSRKPLREFSEGSGLLHVIGL